MEESNDFWVRIIVVSTIILASCSGSGNTTADTDGDTDQRALNLSDYEIFDVEPYADEPASVDVRVIHDVPDELMENRADAGIVQIVPGYRIQVYSSLDPGAAIVAEEELKSWWSRVSDEDKEENQLPLDLTIYNNFKQPLYRIRIGNFTQRLDAERLMAFMASKFATVFVVPDRVTVRR
ncbi:MAG: SPOR domain-containing protein [Bacteroidetes bacterium]|nr:SPOR domain-containing protein [Bacteroidota bacterium]MCH8245844.1 SPOR domain-containing protein [Bacteroidota bacterium]